MFKSPAAWLLALLLAASAGGRGVAQQRPRAVLKGSAEAAFAENEARLQGHNRYVDQLKPFQELASAATFRRREYRVLVDPRFLLLPERAQLYLVADRARKAWFELAGADDLTTVQRGMVKRGAGRFVVALYVEVDGAATIVGRFHLGAKDHFVTPAGELKLFDRKVEAALAGLDAGDAEQFRTFTADLGR